ncbi:hypothetical protein [Kineococcus arenarius]|uniref:hypothetical protein n=1 Tax=Kineococcus sp. SYSU DK007 TaxID=3383128 RepID=UPI003D7EDACF
MFSVLIPVGPKPVELARLQDTVDSLRAHEPAEDVRLVLVDDSLTPRPQLAELEWPTPPVVVRTPLWEASAPPDLKSALVAGAMEGLRAAAAEAPEFCLKMDTDALVIAPFADKVRAALAADPTVGMLGSYDRRCTGERRDWEHKGRAIAAASRPVTVWRRSTRFRVPTGFWYKPAALRARARDLTQQALANGYELGAHCLGGAYAVSPALLQRTDLLDWRPWVRTPDVGEDVTVSLAVFAAGLRIRGMVDRDEPFGLAFQGLPADPRWLVENGHSLVHSLKDHRGSSEEELRTWFREHAR